MGPRCHPERSARKEFPTRFVCGSGGRVAEGPLYLREITTWRGAQQQVRDCRRPKGSFDPSLQHPSKRKPGAYWEPRLRSSLRMTPRKIRVLMNYLAEAVGYLLPARFVA